MDDKALREEVAVRFRRISESLRRTQTQMAAHLGIVRPSYTRYETGKMFPGLSILHRLAKEFDISLDWLIADKGPMFYKDKMSAEEKTARENMAAEVKELLEHMECIPLLHYKVMTFLHQFKLDHKELVESTMKDSGSSPESD